MPLSWRLLLYPVSCLYCLITGIRNRLYRHGIFKSRHFDIPVISIGNLTVGGTGKTPLSEYLLRLLMPHWECALLSRGYGRKTQGVIKADPHSTAVTIGDEPMQMKQKFARLTVVVAEKRVKGMEHLLALPSPPQIVLLDDAFQHRALTPGFSILVMDYYRPVYRDFCLPAGNLRESARNASRAHVLVVNKCPQNLSEEERQHIIKKLNPRKDQKIFFSTISYLPPRKLGDPSANQPMKGKIEEAGGSILGLAGIGNPAPFFEELKKTGLPLTPVVYRDHHEFTTADLQKIEQALQKLGPGALLLTTEKDAVRLAEMKLPPLIMEKSWYLPIQLQILFDEQEAFNKTVTQYVRAT